MAAMLEHANYTVTDPAQTASWMADLFGWHVRWKGDAIDGGRTVHVGTKDHYLALYTPDKAMQGTGSSYTSVGGLNHIAVVVDDLDAMEAKIKGHGFEVGQHYDYEPGRRFYFHDADGIEYEVVQYD